MREQERLDKIAICPESQRLLNILLKENAEFEKIIRDAKNADIFINNIRKWIMEYMKERPDAYLYYRHKASGREAYKKLNWQDYAAIRILDYIDNAGREFENLNRRGRTSVNHPFKQIWLAVHYGRGGGKPQFFEDMIQLFRQYSGKSKRIIPSKKKVLAWMKKHPSGLDPEIIKIRLENRNRILNIIIDRINSGEIKSKRFSFEPHSTTEEKFSKCLEWWNDGRFHLRFAIRSPDLLNRMLNYSLDTETMELLYEAKNAGIPFFVNPYYLSLLNTSEPDSLVGADLAIRDYVIYSKQLIDEFGHIVAWEKEDIVEPGKPNAAGWLLPNKYNIHRRYPDVAILIPDTMGRACAGLCSSCQRMYDFQRGYLNFNLEKLIPNEKWQDKLNYLMNYFENDSQLRDILITGGDALMNSDRSLREILEHVYQMALRKKNKNSSRPENEKYAELVRVRLGTRLPVYLPQRITPELIGILAEFKEKALEVGIKQFVIQTHVESAMEITPEFQEAIKRLISAGWIITNQLVFTAAASRRGHTAKLRQVMNETGILSYYTFTVKGYMENYNSFATNARAVQEQIEEKRFGNIPEEDFDTIRRFHEKPEKMTKNIADLRKKRNLPFLSTDRNVLNLPGVGKSLSFRVIGITRHGRRILEFDHDRHRFHSPIINKMGKVIIIEPKPVQEYLKQLKEFGEDISEYKDIYGYSIGETERLIPVYEYPEYDFLVTDKLTNIEI
jgi:lysine 2,3-aminomutase